MSFTIFQIKKPPSQAIKTNSSKSRKVGIFSKGLTHGFGLQMAVFPTFIFQAIQGRKIAFTIFYIEKTPLQPIKTTSSKSRKIDLFFKGVNPWFWSKNGSFSNFFFLGNIGQENVFYDILERKNACYAIKTRSSISRKIDIFLNVLTHGFGPKMDNFQSFFFRQYRPGKCLFRYSRTKKCISKL